ncbi:MAG: DUF1460 domain-containing protein [Candidatus Wallbacteria bacterium]|nr:DUF1460 domain-containing protein [Candidatus Wallbacteria bacterium]
MLRLSAILILVIQFQVFSASNSSEIQVKKIVSENSKDIVLNIERIGEQFLGRPYDHHGPLGEGKTGKYDQDPLWRLDTFDCTTFVETVLALSISGTLPEFEKNMDKIRYENGKVSYATRNHFPCVDWIPNNLKNGLLEDITEIVAGPGNFKFAEGEIDKKHWYLMKKKDEIKVPSLSGSKLNSLLISLKQEGLDFKPLKPHLPYLPLDVLLPVLSQGPGTGETYTVETSILDRIPSGCVINIVRPSWNLRSACGTLMNVSHQGFVIRKNGEVLLRHASSNGAVMEQNLTDYLLKYRNSPTLKGINLLSVKAQG